MSAARIAALIFSVWLLLVDQAFAEPAATELLYAARVWESKSRADLARVALEKYLHVVPDDPQALLRLGELELRSNHAAAAEKLLKRLQASHAGAPEAGYLADAYRVATRDRLKMATVNRLVQIDRVDEALTALNELFPEGPAGGELGIEYNHVLASSPTHWAEAEAGYRRLVAQNPRDPLYLFALAKHLLGHEAGRSEAAGILAALAKQGDFNRQEVLDKWREAIIGELSDPHAEAQILQYLASAPDDLELRQKFESFHRKHAEQELRRTDPVLRLIDEGLAKLEHGQLDMADDLLAKALLLQPRNLDAISAVGHLRYRQARYDEARELFNQAAQVDAAHAERWRNQIRDVDFQDSLKRARDSEQLADLPAAEKFARRALDLRPADSSARIELADIRNKAGHTADAETIYRDVLSHDPGNGHALAELLQLMQNAGHWQEAQNLLTAQRNRWPSDQGKFNRMLAAILRQQADAAFVNGHGGQGLQMLERAQQTDPTDPWIRYDLANRYRQMSLPDEARQLMSEGVRLRPTDVDMHYADALLLSSLDDPEAAIEQLRLVPPDQRSAGMRALERRLSVVQLRLDAANLATHGDHSGAVDRLTQAVTIASEEPELLAEVGSSFIDINEVERGLRDFRHWIMAHSPASVEARVLWARLLDQAHSDDELDGVLDLLRQATLSPDEQARIDSIQASHWMRQARELVAKGNAVQAAGFLRSALESRPQEPALVKTLAETEEQIGHYEQAGTLLKSNIARDPGDLDARLSLARVLRKQGHVADAQHQLDEVLRRASADDLDDRLAVARQRLSLNDRAGARAAIDPLLLSHPDDAALLMQAGKIERDDGRFEEALSYFRRSLSSEVPAPVADQKIPDVPAAAMSLRPDSSLSTSSLNVEKSAVPLTLQLALAWATALSPKDAPVFDAGSPAAREIAQIEQRRHGYLATAEDYSGKPGDPGISQYTARQQVVELRLAQGYSGHWFAQVDPAHVDAGVLPGSYDGAGLYGKNPAYGVGGYSGGSRQSAAGTAIGLGWESDDWRVDLGTTPIGFPVQDVVGGLRYDGRVAGLNYTLDASRRPLTSSLLSYAGAYDPVTGEIWGGARSNGLDTRLAYYGEVFSSAVSLGFHEITGRNLPMNAYRSARLSGNWHFYDAPNMRLDAGLAATYWSYAQDLSHYTFGQGGYYSPQSYVSIGLPLEWAGRWGALSYRLRGSGSVSRTRSHDAQFFPHDPALQAQAASVVNLPQGYTRPVFSGSDGNGHGYSVAGNLEYRVLSRWNLGALIQIDRSAYYTPNFLSAYLRYDFDQQSGAVVFPPSPPRLYADF